jgi:peptidyl-prolyl cis-trans isomerase B (cyclophilin B)
MTGCVEAAVSIARMLTRSLAALATLLLLALGACSEEDAGKDSSASDPATSATAESSQEAGQAPSDAAGTCTYSPDGMQAANVGDLKVVLDAGKTPCTVNSFLSLAEQGYFDDTQCHRLTTQGIYVLQCGDPTATGSGGPGYQFDDELTGKETYGAGTLAMANAGPGTNGSQFFIVYQDSMLDPNYTVFGTVDAAGIKTVQGVAAKGTTNGQPDGAPKQAVTITGVG